MPEIEVGQEAPDFSVTTALHGTVSLSQFRDKQPVALVFFRTFFTGNNTRVGGVQLVPVICPACHIMMRDLVRYYDRVRELSGEIVAISTVHPRHLERVRAIGEPKFPLCADADSSITKRYGVYHGVFKHPKPATFLIDRAGVVHLRHIARQFNQMDVLRGEQLGYRVLSKGPSVPGY